MNKLVWAGMVALFLGSGTLQTTLAIASEAAPWEQESAPTTSVSDPIEPVNRLMFDLNDSLYFYVLKPVSQGYAEVVPEGGRVAVKNAFSNVTTPVRLVNALLQGKFEGAGVELARFGINTVMGAFGLFDIAEMHFDLKPVDEDFGQTLGTYGVGDQVYIVWPIFGASTMRDTVGMAGDYFLSPLSYVPQESEDRLGISGARIINNTSLVIGQYESLKEASIDPYIAVRDAYLQNRREKIAK